jgi:glycosyltransferase involved in cell wall biosynthesis
MLSICIPIYNFDVQILVNNLHQQGVVAQIDFEIVCFDDGSKENFKNLNKNIQNLPFVNYIELPKNLGRSKIRNELGKAAKYPYLIFMDCDSATIDDFYIENYVFALENLNQQELRKNSRTKLPLVQNNLLYGGRVYKKNPPTNPHFFFHWKYGTQREQISPNIRQQNEHHAFMTNNFLIPKKLFLDIQFDESLTQYGHEDTLFGLELKQRNIPILHLDNPLIHIGLETTEVFLMKTKMGIQNLHFLNQKTNLIQSKLLNMFRRFQQLKITWLLTLFYTIFKKRLVVNFHSKNPNMRLFDLYKLGYLAKYNSSQS